MQRGHRHHGGYANGRTLLASSLTYMLAAARDCSAKSGYDLLGECDWSLQQAMRMFKPDHLVDLSAFALFEPDRLVTKCTAISSAKERACI